MDKRNSFDDLVRENRRLRKLMKTKNKEIRLLERSVRYAAIDLDRWDTASSEFWIRREDAEQTMKKLKEIRGES